MPRDLVALKSRSAWNFAMAVLRSRERDTLKLSYGSTIGSDKFRNDLRECANAMLCVQQDFFIKILLNNNRPLLFLFSNPRGPCVAFNPFDAPMTKAKPFISEIV